MAKAKTAVYPGTFDPVTNGHVEIIRRAAAIFDKVIVAVAHNKGKSPFFSVKERVAMLKSAVKGIGNVTVDDFDGLVVKYIRTVGSSVMIRGLRAVSDFEYEFQMALTNRKLAGDIETIFLVPSESSLYLSSKLIKEAAYLGADIGDFVPNDVRIMVEKKLQRKR
jgi:pantetheine-phosphate adenylyltransferase